MSAFYQISLNFPIQNIFFSFIKLYYYHRDYYTNYINRLDKMAELIIFVVLFHFLQDHLMEIIFKFNNRRLKIYVFSVFNYRVVFEFINLDTKNIRNYLFILN